MHYFSLNVEHSLPTGFVTHHLMKVVLNVEVQFYLFKKKKKKKIVLNIEVD
jgi:hypothetical protein